MSESTNEPTPAPADSILVTTKRMLDLAEEYTAFDAPVITHINSALAELTQIGVGPDEGFMIIDASATWSELLEEDKRLNMAKSLVFLLVQMMFDPAQTQFLMTARQAQVDKLIWRINVAAESTLNPSAPLVIDGGSP